MPLDAETQRIKNEIMKMYSALSKKYGSLFATVPSSDREDEARTIDWRNGEIWIYRGNNGPADRVATWQGTPEILLVAQRLPHLLDALDEAVRREAERQAKTAEALSSALAGVRGAQERLGLTPYHRAVACHCFSGVNGQDHASDCPNSNKEH